MAADFGDDREVELTKTRDLTSSEGLLAVGLAVSDLWNSPMDLWIVPNFLDFRAR